MQQESRFISLQSVVASLVLVAGSLVLPGVVYADSSVAIKKCQDADGNWHYGTLAAEACADAVVDELSESGTRVGQDLPPPSEEELRRKEELAKAIEEQKEFAVEQREKDLEIVRIYSSEESIISTRDRKIESIDNNVEVTRQIKAGTVKDIKKLEKMKQTNKVKKLLQERVDAVESYDRVIRHNLGEKEKLAQKYEQILKDFRAASRRIYGE